MSLYQLDTRDLPLLINQNIHENLPLKSGLA